MICPVTQSNWLQTEVLKLFLFLSEIPHTDSCPDSEHTRKGYCHSLLTHWNLAASLNEFLCWHVLLSTLSCIFPAPGYGGHVKPGEAKVRAVCSLCDFFFLFWEKMSPCSIFGGTAWITGEPVPWLQYCRSSCKAQPPHCPSSPQARYPGTVHTWDAYKLLIVFLSEASPNTLAFPKQKQIWIAELARKTNSNPALSENTARCHE